MTKEEFLKKIKKQKQRMVELRKRFKKLTKSEK